MSEQNGTSHQIVMSPGHYDPLAAAMALVPKVLDREALAEWITEKSDPALAKEQCCLFSLTHDSDDRGPVVMTQESLAKTLGPVERDMRVLKIVKAFADASQATTETANATKPQRFIVGAHLRAHKDEHAQFQYVFTLTPPPEIEARQEKEANMAQMLGHLARLADASVKTMAQTLLQVTDRLMERDKERDARTDAMEASRLDMRRQCEELLSARDLRDIQVYKAKRDIDLENKLYTALFEYGGVAFKKYLGVENEKNPMLDFVKTLEPDQLLGFIGNLTDAQREAFAPILPAVVDSLSPEKKALLAAATEQAIAARAEVKP